MSIASALAVTGWILLFGAAGNAVADVPVGPGPTNYTEQPQPAPGTCHYRTAADGETLPDPNCTPGAISPKVTQDTIATTICRTGYTKSIRSVVAQAAQVGSVVGVRDGCGNQRDCQQRAEHAHRCLHVVPTSQRRGPATYIPLALHRPIGHLCLCWVAVMPETAGAANAMSNQPPPTVIQVAGLIAGHLGTVEGRVEEVSQIRKAGKTTRIVVIGDTTGELRLKFSPPAGTDMRPEQLLQVTGKPRRSRNGPVYMSNPSYRVLETPESGSSGSQGDP